MLNLCSNFIKSKVRLTPFSLPVQTKNAQLFGMLLIRKILPNRLSHDCCRAVMNIMNSILTDDDRSAPRTHFSRQRPSDLQRLAPEQLINYQRLISLMSNTSIYKNGLQDAPSYHHSNVPFFILIFSLHPSFCPYSSSSK
jgi:hypothetical protein